MKSILYIFLQRDGGGFDLTQFIIPLVVLLIIGFYYSKQPPEGKKKICIVGILIGIVLIIVSQAVTTDFNQVRSIEAKSQILYLGLIIFLFSGIMLTNLLLRNKSIIVRNTNGNVDDNRITLSVSDEIKKLHDLKEAGVITHDEFESRKNKLINL